MSKVYKFSEFVLDKQSITFYCRNVPVQLSSRAFEMLVYLIEKRGRVVEKEEILDKVWKDSFVEESNLAVHISALRRVLREKKGETRFIRTISGRGYSFVAEVEEIEFDQIISKKTSGQSFEEKKPTSIAVLPFSFEYSSEDNEYLANGVTQSLIGDLSKNQDLRVLAYSAVKPYKNSEMELQEIGFLLDADKILTGSISEFKGRWEISAELINAGDKRCLWATTQTFDEQDIFLIKRQISSAISENLKLKLISESLRGQEIDSEAQKLYYRGKFILESRSTKKEPEVILYQALKFFKKAIKREPNYALAHVGIGSVYVSLFNHNLLDRKTSLDHAHKALQMAFVADSSLSEVYVLKGSIDIIIDTNFLEAEKNLDKALELNPNNPDTYHWKSYLYLHLGKFEQALSLEEKAINLDPVSSRYYDNLIRIFYFSGNYSKAIIQSDELLEFDDKILSAYFFKSLSYTQLGFFDEAIEYIDKVLELRHTSEVLLNKAFIYAYFNKNNEAEKILYDIISGENKTDFTDIALVFAGLNKIKQSIDYLHKAHQDGSANLRFIKIDIRFKNLWNDPRFEDLLEKLNLK